MPRLFIAIEFSTELREQLLEIQAHLRRQTASGRFVQAKNLHLTLQFLGDVAEQQVPGIVASLRQVACKNRFFSLELGEPGVFGSINPYRVVWLGLAGELSVLRQLQAEVEISMAGLGFSSDHNLYRPHITLARDVAFCGHGHPVWEYQQERRHAFTVRQFTLMDSSLNAGKHVYRQVQHFYLSGDRNKRETSRFA